LTGFARNEVRRRFTRHKIMTGQCGQSPGTIESDLVVQQKLYPLDVIALPSVEEAAATLAEAPVDPGRHTGISAVTETGGVPTEQLLAIAV
jgi:hypothetical protein